MDTMPLMIVIVVAVISIAVTAALFLARQRRWIKDEQYEELVRLANIISGITSVLSVVVAIVALLMALPPASPPSPSPAPPVSPAFVPTATLPQPTPPLGSPTPITQTPAIPPGYSLYDDFTAPNALKTNWSLNDEHQICDLSIRDGQLVFDCTNNAATDLGAALHPSRFSRKTTGVAATVRVDRVGGPLQLATRWLCPETNDERAYHFELGTDSATAIEFYPLEGWRRVELGQLAIEPGQMHLLQIERTSQGLAFFVDGQPMTLTTAPNLSACFSMSTWSLDFYVWKDGNRLQGAVDQVSVRE